MTIRGPGDQSDTDPNEVAEARRALVRYVLAEASREGLKGGQLGPEIVKLVEDGVRSAVQQVARDEQAKTAQGIEGLKSEALTALTAATQALERESKRLSSERPPEEYGQVAQNLAKAVSALEGAGAGGRLQMAPRKSFGGFEARPAPKTRDEGDSGNEDSPEGGGAADAPSLLALARQYRPQIVLIVALAVLLGYLGFTLLWPKPDPQDVTGPASSGQVEAGTEATPPSAPEVGWKKFGDAGGLRGQTARVSCDTDAATCTFERLSGANVAIEQRGEITRKALGMLASRTNCGPPDEKIAKLSAKQAEQFEAFARCVQETTTVPIPPPKTETLRNGSESDAVSQTMSWAFAGLAAVV